MAAEQEVSCGIVACGLCMERQCTARLDGVIPGDVECPGYLTHRVVDSEAALFLRRRSYPLPQGWRRVPSGGAGGQRSSGTPGLSIG